MGDKLTPEMLNMLASISPKRGMTPEVMQQLVSLPEPQYQQAIGLLRRASNPSREHTESVGMFDAGISAPAWNSAGTAGWNPLRTNNHMRTLLGLLSNAFRR